MTTALRDHLADALDRASERPRVRPDAEIAERTTRWGEREAVIHAPGTAYLRLSGEEAVLARALDGRHTLAQLAAAGFDDPDGLSVDDAVALVADLRSGRFLLGAPVDVYAAVRARVATRRERRWQRIANALKHQAVAIRRADVVAGALYRRGGWLLFTWPAVLLAATAASGGLLALARSDGPIVTTDVSGANAALLVTLLFGVLLLHELGHALAVKRAGRDVVRAGFMLYLGHPAFFVDSTDLVFANRRQRAVNAVAGPFVEAAVAGVAACVAALAPHAAAASTLNRFAALSYFNVALNLVPFVELDGYWLLTDLLETPRLRARSFAVLRYEVPARILRRRPAFSPAERAVALFGAVGLLTTAGALALAARVWWRLARQLVLAGWRAGLPGRAAVVVVAAIVIGPLVEVAWRGAAGIWHMLHRAVDDVRFRTQTGWRVEAATAIAALPHAGDLDDDTLSEVAGRVARRRVRAREAVVRQGAAADAFFLVRAGAFEVVERGADGTDRVLRRVGPGDSFGEVGLIDRRPRTATVRALTDGEVFELDAGAFTRLLGPAFGAPALMPALGPALELQSLPPLRKLTLEEASVVAQRAAWLDVRAGEAIVVQGEVADGFYVVVSGQAHVERDGAPVASLRAGDHFGEVALEGGGTRNATVRAITPARVVRIDADTFHALVAAALAHHCSSSTERSLGGEFA